MVSTQFTFLKIEQIDMIVVEIVLIILAIVIGIISAIGINLKISHLFRAIFPPARQYLNTIEGISKMERLGYKNNRFWEGVLNKEDTGFNEVSDILRQNRILEKDAGKIVIWEERSEKIENGEIVRTPPTRGHLLVEIDGKLSLIKTVEPNSTEITRELSDKARDNYQRQLAYSILICLTIWLILQSYLIYLYHS